MTHPVCDGVRMIYARPASYAILSTLAWIAGGLSAKDAPSPNPGDWSIRTYWIDFNHALQWRQTFSVPPPDAPQAQIVDFIRTATATIGPEMQKAGALVPGGTLIAADPSTGLVSVRTTEEAHEFWRALDNESYSPFPSLIHCRLDLVEVREALASDLLNRSLASPEPWPILDELSKAESRNEARWRRSQSWSTKSGQQVATESIGRIRDSQDGSRTRDTPAHLDRNQPGSGLRVEIDPVVGADRQTIDMNIWMRDTLTSGAIFSNRPFESEISTSMLLVDGQSRLVGSWGSQESGWQTMVVMTASLGSAQPAMNRHLETWLQKYGEFVSPTPPTKHKRTPPPKGMAVRRYRVPPDFLSMVGLRPVRAATHSRPPRKETPQSSDIEPRKRSWSRWASPFPKALVRLFSTLQPFWRS